MRFTLSIGSVLLLAMVSMPGSMSAQDAESGPLIRLARPSQVVTPAPATVPDSQAQNEPSTRETPATVANNARDNAAARREPRGILAPFFNRNARNDSSSRTLFTPRRPVPAPPQAVEETNSEPETTTTNSVANVPAPATPSSPSVVPSLPLDQESSATLRLAQRSATPPAIRPAPPQQMMVGSVASQPTPPIAAPLPSSVAVDRPQDDTCETPNPSSIHSRPSVVSGPQPTPADPATRPRDDRTPSTAPNTQPSEVPAPTNLVLRPQNAGGVAIGPHLGRSVVSGRDPATPARNVSDPTPDPVEPQVVEVPTPAPVVPRVAQRDPQQRVLTIDRNDPQVPEASPQVARQQTTPAPQQFAPRSVIRPIREEAPALPELTVFMGGAEKVLHGENVSVKVRIVNSGRGAAREVILDIVGNDQLLKTLPVGAIPAGRSVEVEIQLTPQVLGQLELQAVAKARDGERAVAVRSMFVGKPEISLAIAGPAKVNFGEVQIYTAIVDNKGNADAEDVSLLIMLQGKEAQSLVLGNVLAGQRRRVSFELRPELGGVLSLNAVATAVGGVQAVANGSINVMQQQIAMAIVGPRTLRFGEAARFTLKLQNTGNTDAENVVINVNMGESVLEGLFEGTLAMGEQKELMFEVSPAMPGNQTLTAVALSGSGTTAAATARLQVQHGQLELSAAGPNANFSGGKATYDVLIKNVGDAPAEDVLVTAHLPQGAEFLGGVDRIDFYEGITWRIGTLQPGERKVYPLECLLEAAGEQKIVFSASGADELSATHEVVTSVAALADIRLFVADPKGLVAIGEDAVYEIELHNRGVKEARDVQLKLLLGDAIRPIATEGLAAQLSESGVVFETIDRLGAKETRKIRVTMQATQGGSHQFRFEVSATDPETFVASEGTTRFYAKSKPIAPSRGSELPVERTATPGGSTFR